MKVPVVPVVSPAVPVVDPRRADLGTRQDHRASRFLGGGG